MRNFGTIRQIVPSGFFTNQKSLFIILSKYIQHHLYAYVLKIFYFIHSRSPIFYRSQKKKNALLRLCTKLTDLFLYQRHTNVTHTRIYMPFYISYNNFFITHFHRFKGVVIIIALSHCIGSTHFFALADNCCQHTIRERAKHTYVCTNER